MVRQRSATPLPPVRIWVAPPKKDRTPLGVLSFFAVTHSIGLAPCDLSHGIQFANSTKGRSALAWELLGEFSSQGELSGWRTKRCPVFFAVTHQFGLAPLLSSVPMFSPTPQICFFASIKSSLLYSIVTLHNF